jgi:acetyl esterase/lipase
MWSARALSCALVVIAGCMPAARDETLAFGGAARVHSDLAYLWTSASQKLDLYVPIALPAPPPLVVFVHGGGWMSGRKDDALPSVARFLSAGWAVANVEYRLGYEATAPAAAADVRCAVKWAANHGAEYGYEAGRIVLAGESAGAHLVLLAAFADTSARFDVSCPAPMPAVAGVIDWAGITDVNDLIAGPNERGWATGWVGFFPDAAARARLASPLRWIRPGLPPVLIVHGDSDRTVPFSHAQRLHHALDDAGVANELVVIPGGDHGPASAAEADSIWAAIRRFLTERNGAAPPRAGRPHSGSTDP